MKNYFLILVFSVLSISLHAAEPKPDLLGRVLDYDDKPIRNATVFVYTAGPKQGTGTICPSCYPDCRKTARTGADGKFKIEALGPKLIFRLLVVAGGMQPKFITKVDPAAGAQEVFLDPIDDDPDRVATRGIIINSEGEPVFGGVLNVEGVERGRGTRWGGVERDADPVAVSDENGLFTLRCSKEVAAVHARLETAGYAKQWVRLTPGTDHLLRIQSGVIVRGELWSKDKPVQDAVVAMATVEREAGKHLHDFEAITDKNGKFAILNVTPERDYYLFGKMGTLREAGALGVMPVKAGLTETTIDLGKINLNSAHTLRGRVVLADEGPIPPKTRLMLGRDGAWDYTETTLGPDGSFELKGLPAESVSLNVRIRGYKASRKNPSLDWYNGGIIGRVEKDLTDFIILLEPGEWRYNGEEIEGGEGIERQPRDLPLRSAVLQ